MAIDFKIEKNGIGEKLGGVIQSNLGGPNNINGIEQIGSVMNIDISQIDDMIGLSKDFINRLKNASDLVDTMKMFQNLSIIGTSTADYTIPSVKNCLLSDVAAVQTKKTEKFKDVQQQQFDLNNQRIAFNSVDIVDNIVRQANAILDIVEPAANAILVQYIKIPIKDIRYKASSAFQYVKMLKRVKRKKRNDEDQETIAEDTSNNVTKTSTLKQNISNVTNLIIPSGQIKSIKNMVSKDLDEHQIKNKILDWIKASPPILVNGFCLLLLINDIDKIRMICQRIGNMSIESLADVVNDVALTIGEVFKWIESSSISNALSEDPTTFNMVTKLFDAMYPIIELMKLICKLQDNYEYNKNKALHSSYANISDVLGTVVSKTLGLIKCDECSNVNMYPIRTQDLKEWCFQYFDINNLISNQLYKLSTKQSEAFIQHIKQIGIYDNGLDASRETVLYFNIDSNDSNTIKDGTLDGVDNILYDDETGTIYYDPTNRSTISSQILKAIKLNEPSDGYVHNDEDEASLFDSITIYTDEIEGQQTISIPDMNLCDLGDYSEQDPTQSHNDPISDEIYNSDKSYAIIEFGDEYTRGKSIDYVVSVKPGEDLYLNKTIGYMIKDGIQVPIYSKFSKGYVKPNIDGTDYYRVFPSSCNRHIVIADYEEDDNFSEGTEQDPIPPKMNEFMDEFKNSTEISAMVLSFLPYSVLPIVLYNSDRFSSGSPSTLFWFDNKLKAYEKYIKDTGKEFKNGNKFSAKLMRSSKLTADSVSSIKQQMMEKREEMIGHVWDIYNDALSSKVVGDDEYGDCVDLAYGSNKDIYEFSFDDNSNVYQNYYMSIYSMIDQASDNQNIVEYKQLIKKIIDRRMDQEDYNYSDLVYDFNKLFKETITSKKVSNGYQLLFDINRSNKMSYDDVISYIKDQYIKYHNISLQDALDQTSLEQTSRRLANIFFYILDANPNSIPTAQSQTEKTKEEKYEEVKTTYISIFNECIGYTFGDGDAIKRSLDIYKKVYNKNSKDNKYTLKELAAFFIQGLDKLSVEMTGSAILDNKMAILKKNKEYIYDMISYISKYQSNVSVSFNKKEETPQFIKNRKAYTLIEKEAQEITEYWNNIKTIYYNDCQISKIINNLSDYANSLNTLSNWPLPQDVEIGGKTYQLYEFMDVDSSIDTNVDDLAEPSVEEPTDETTKANTNVELDYESVAIIKEPNEKTIRQDDISYWVRYMLNATVATLVPTYWADGFDIPPSMTPILLPAIYFPIADPITMKSINVTIVVGIALRGIWVMPIILVLNNNSNAINAAFPIMIGLEKAQKAFKAAQEKLEQDIRNKINEQIDSITGDIDKYKKLQDKYMLYASLISSIYIPDKQYIENSLYGLIGRSKNDYYNKKQKILKDIQSYLTKNNS